MFLPSACQKSYRFAQSVLVSERYSFVDALDFAHWAKTDLSKLLGRLVSLLVFVDSESFFGLIMQSSLTQKRRLMLDVLAVIDAYALHNISNVGFVRDRNNPAEDSTKISKFHALYHLMQAGNWDFIVNQWVIGIQRAVIPTNNLSTAPLCYNRSCRTNNTCSSREIITLYERFYGNASFKNCTSGRSRIFLVSI